MHARDVSKQIPREKNFHRVENVIKQLDHTSAVRSSRYDELRLEQLLRIFRALQTSRVLHISINARWSMNQLLNYTRYRYINCFPPSLTPDSCTSKGMRGRIECGWPNITKEQCLARNCCYDNTINHSNTINSGVDCFVRPHLGE